MRISNRKWKNLSLAIVLLTVIVFVFEILPRAYGVIELAAELISNNNKLERSVKIEDQMGALTRENRKLKESIGILITNYDEVKQLSGVLSSLEDASKFSECEISSIKPLKLENRKNLWLQHMELIITGGYDNLYNYLRYLENSKKVTVVNYAGISPSKEKSGKLEMTLNMEVYLNL